ncbi:hypothetical protein F5877DRAFT_72557 [Lentinula edodes]|nr:hypothetical protein F5877DRAFT_72557 [Lentinula edodes]
MLTLLLVGVIVPIPSLLLLVTIVTMLLLGELEIISLAMNVQKLVCILRLGVTNGVSTKSVHNCNTNFSKAMAAAKSLKTAPRLLTFCVTVILGKDVDGGRDTEANIANNLGVNLLSGFESNLIVLPGFNTGGVCRNKWRWFTGLKEGFHLGGPDVVVITFEGGDNSGEECRRHCYAYLITFWQQPAKLSIVIWSLLALIGFCVQCFLTYRIWKLSAVSGTKMCVTIFVNSFVSLGLSVTVNALAAVGDLLVACILSLLLQRSKTGSRRYGVMTWVQYEGLCLHSELAVFAPSHRSSHCLSFYLTSCSQASCSAVYTNSLLATLNARRMIGDVAEGPGFNITTGDNICASSSKLEFQRSRNLDTITRESLSDLEHGVVQDIQLSVFKHEMVEIKEDTSEVNLLNGVCLCGVGSSPNAKNILQEVEPNISSGIECTAV